jgi:uncharacterized protein YecT (DUF1311 family)
MITSCFRGRLRPLRFMAVLAVFSLAPGAETAPSTAPAAETKEAPHPLDVAMEAELRDVGPDTRSASVLGRYEDMWDVELNKIYKSWMAELGPSGRAKLKNAQRAWISYRDQEKQLVRFAHMVEEDSSLPTMTLAFIAYQEMKLTRDRTVALISLRKQWGETRANKALGD